MMKHLNCALFGCWLVAWLTGSAVSAELHVGPGQDYTTIQSAVGAAVPGDTVIVHDGFYAENVLVDKQLTLLSHSYTSSGQNDGVIIDAGGNGHGLLITAAGTVVEGFSVYGATGWDDPPYSGILVYGADGCVVNANRCGWDHDHANTTAIHFMDSNHLVVTGNEVSYAIYGLFIKDCNDSEFRGNMVHHITYGTSSQPGIYLVGELDGSYQSTAQRNLFIANQLYHNNVAINVLSLAWSNTFSSNLVENNNTGIIVNSDSKYNVFSGNTVRNNTNRGIHIRGTNYSTITSNQFDNCRIGIWLGDGSTPSLRAHYNTVSLNTIINNHIYGIRIAPNCIDNRMFLNHFENNATNVRSEGTFWSTPNSMSYFYSGTNQGNHLGNFYDTYTGIDTNGDGIGDTDIPFNDGSPTYGPLETHPLVASPTGYGLQAWYLGGGVPAKLVYSDMTGIIGEVTIPANEAVVWTSNEAATEDLVFPAGSWCGQLRYVYEPYSGALTIEIGTSAGGGGFTPSGAQASAADGTLDVSFATNAEAVTVSAGEHLAVRLTNHSEVNAYLLRAGGSMSYVSSPGFGDPQWPGEGVSQAPETRPTAALLAQNHPNPFNPKTVISFSLPSPQIVHLRIYDLAGRHVRTLLQATSLPAGERQIAWDGCNESGNQVASGVYIYRLQTELDVQTRSMTLVR